MLNFKIDLKLIKTVKNKKEDRLHKIQCNHITHKWIEYEICQLTVTWLHFT